MKLHLGTLLFATYATVAVTAASSPDAEAICGRLGVMKVDPEDLPEGVLPSDVRMCADHPMSAANLWGWGDYVPRWVY